LTFREKGGMVVPTIFKDQGNRIPVLIPWPETKAKRAVIGKLMLGSFPQFGFRGMPGFYFFLVNYPNNFQIGILKKGAPASHSLSAVNIRVSLR